jgi:hypothetical protein
VSRTAGGWPAVSGAVLETLAGDPDSAWFDWRGSPVGVVIDGVMMVVGGKFGTAFEHFGGGKAGEAACKALDSL